MRPHVLGAGDAGIGEPLPAFRDRILDEMGDDAADQLVDAARPLEIRIKRRRSRRPDVAQEIDLARPAAKSNSPARKPVVDVMRIIGDVVGERRGLRLGAGEDRPVRDRAGASYSASPAAGPRSA